MKANFISSGSSPGKLYGTVKVHKPNFLARPVVSMVNTPKYSLAKFLDDMIKPYFIADSHAEINWSLYRGIKRI